MNINTLYGDGIHDDTAAIQEMIDSGLCQVTLPPPQKHYLISRPLEIPSNFKLELPRFAEIRLADGANCFMLKNKTVCKPQKKSRDDRSDFDKELWKYADTLSPEPEDACHDFEIEGGIWNFNNLNQDPNPIQTCKFDDRNFVGHTMFFFNARSFRLCNMTFKDPTNYAVTMDTCSYFTVDNITFDFNYGNPYAVNMDGIHLNGNCHFGTINDLKGACYDDLVALNAHEGTGGDITNISISNIMAENCHSAVRLLTVKDQVQNISISNVFGTYYQYCIALTKYYPGKATGAFDSIMLSGIYASKAVRLPIQEVQMGDGKDYHFPLIFIQSDTVTKHLSIEHLHRKEHINPVDTIYIGETAIVEDLLLSDLTIENHTDSYCAMLRNEGKVGRLTIDNPCYIENTSHGTVDIINK